MHPGHAAGRGMTCGLVGFLALLVLVLGFWTLVDSSLASNQDSGLSLDEADDAVVASDSAMSATLPWAIVRIGIPFVLIPARVKRERLLDHAIRRRILEEVGRHPGIHHRELLRILGVSNGTLAYHLRQLELAGYLHFARAHGRKYLWVPEDEIDEEFLLMTERDRELLALLTEIPSARISELSPLCGLKASSVGYHVDRLRALGRVEAHRQGHALVLSLAAADGGTPKVCTTNNALA